MYTLCIICIYNIYNYYICLITSVMHLCGIVHWVVEFRFLLIHLNDGNEDT